MLKWSILLLPLSSSLSTHQCKSIKRRKTHQIGCDAIPNSNNTIISKQECLNHGCCWQLVGDRKKRCFQDTKDEEHQWKDPSLHNSYLVIPTFIPETTQISPIQAEKLRSESKSNCLKSIDILTKLNNGKSCTKSVKIEERKPCEISQILEQNPTISSCTACIMVGCCFDPSFNMLSNNKLAPMCFNTTESFANKEENNFILTTTAQPTTTQVPTTEKVVMNIGMGVRSTIPPWMQGKEGGDSEHSAGSKYKDILQQKYGISLQDRAEFEKLQPQVNAADAKSSRLDSYLSMLSGGKAPEKSISPIKTASGSSNSRLQALTSMLSSGNKMSTGSGNSRLSALSSMLNGGSGLEAIKQKLMPSSIQSNIGNSKIASLVSGGFDMSKIRQAFGATTTRVPITELPAVVSPEVQKKIDIMRSYYEQQGKPTEQIDMMISKLSAMWTVKSTAETTEKPITKPMVVTTKAPFQSVQNSPRGSSKSFIPGPYIMGNDEPAFCYPQQCGRPLYDNHGFSNTLKKVVGGQHAGQPGYWPWQVSIRRSYTDDPIMQHLCGGTLISEYWVLSASHCFEKYYKAKMGMSTPETDPTVYTIHAGRYHKTRPERWVQIRQVAEFFPHPEFSYTAKDQKNDIALARFNSPVHFDDYVQPACLPSPDTPAEVASKMWITGWGETHNVGGDNLYLKEVSLPIAEEERCRVEWGRFWNPGWLCAESGLNEDACGGDSGGPAVERREDGRYRILGVTIAGSRDCSTTKKGVKSGVYANVVFYRNWIDRVTRGMCG